MPVILEVTAARMKVRADLFPFTYLQVVLCWAQEFPDELLA